jgi:hypothetical protein
MQTINLNPLRGSLMTEISRKEECAISCNEAVVVMMVVVVIQLGSGGDDGGGGDTMGQWPKWQETNMFNIYKLTNNIGNKGK